MKNNLLKFTLFIMIILLGKTFVQCEEQIKLMGQTLSCDFDTVSPGNIVHCSGGCTDLEHCSEPEVEVSIDKDDLLQKNNLTPREKANKDILKDYSNKTHVYGCPNSTRTISYSKDKYSCSVTTYISSPNIHVSWDAHVAFERFPIDISLPHIFGFFCNFDYKKFMKTHRFEANSFNVSLFSTPNEQAVVPAPQKAQTYPIENRKDTTFLNEKFFLMPLQTSSLNSGIRIFQNKEKNKELRVIFSSTDKNSFLTKLQTEHREHLNSQTTCPNGNILFEIFNDGVYEAFLLDKQAIVVLAESYSTQPEDLFNKKKQELLCQTNPISFY